MAVASCNAASCDLGTGPLDGFFDGSLVFEVRESLYAPNEAMHKAGLCHSSSAVPLEPHTSTTDNTDSHEKLMASITKQMIKHQPP
jgi:hypothetical protein